MTLLSEILIVGIGSDFGDDQVGVIVAEKLSERLHACTVLKIRSPLALIDHLGNSKQLHIVDACRAGGQPGTITRYDWPVAQGIESRFSGTHDFGLLATLHLAEGMGLLPQKVAIWSIEIEGQDYREGFSQPLTPAVARGADLLVDQVVNKMMEASIIQKGQLPHA